MTTPAAEWVCQWCPSHIVIHLELSTPPIHWCSGRGHRQYEMVPIRLGGDTPDAA